MMASRHGVQTSSSSSSGNRFCRDFSIQTPPRSAHDVDQILHHLRMLNDPKDPTLIQKVSPGVLQEITREQWLGALWHVVDESIGHADEEGCAVVADMLCYMSETIDIDSIQALIILSNSRPSSNFQSQCMPSPLTLSPILPSLQHLRNEI